MPIDKTSGKKGLFIGGGKLLMGLIADAAHQTGEQKIDVLSTSGSTSGSIRSYELSEQESYKLRIRGLDSKKQQKDKVTDISVVDNGYDSSNFQHWKEVMDGVANGTYEYVLSNVAESFLNEEKAAEMPEEMPADTHIGRMTQLLHAKFKGEGKDEPFSIIPTEIIKGDNGQLLKEALLKQADKWNLKEGFDKYIEGTPIATTLPDRIVSKGGISLAGSMVATLLKEFKGKNNQPSLTQDKPGWLTNGDVKEEVIKKAQALINDKVISADQTFIDYIREAEINFSGKVVAEEDFHKDQLEEGSKEDFFKSYYVEGEPYGKFFIKKDPNLNIPFKSDIIQEVPEVKPYYDQKVGLLNAFHTAMVHKWIQNDREPPNLTVEQIILGPEEFQDLKQHQWLLDLQKSGWITDILDEIKGVIREEVPSYIDVNGFAEQVLTERFVNPTLHHKLDDISAGHAKKLDERIDWVQTANDVATPKLDDLMVGAIKKSAMEKGRAAFDAKLDASKLKPPVIVAIKKFVEADGKKAKGDGLDAAVTHKQFADNARKLKEEFGVKDVVTDMVIQGAIDAYGAELGITRGRSDPKS